MLTNDERDGLRWRALQAWHEAKALTDASNSVVADALRITTASHTIRERARLARRREVVETVDGVVTRDDHASYPCSRNGGPLALLALSHAPTVVSVYEVARRGRWRMVDALNGAVAVGVAMLTQPDCAVIDGALAMVAGLDVANGLQLYAPRTAVLIMTGDSDIDTQARHEGFITIGKSAPAQDIVDAMDSLVA